MIARSTEPAHHEGVNRSSDREHDTVVRNTEAAYRDS
jgi:hypothetical protein